MEQAKVTKINVFLQGEGIKDVLRMQVDPASTVLALKHSGIEGPQIGDDAMVFLEDQDEAVADAVTIGSITGRHGVRLHVHRCQRVAVKVVYSGRTIEHIFGPGRTVGSVKMWATKELGIPKEDAAELILQIFGAQEQPDVDVHIGALATCPACAVTFDLVPNPRIQGTV